MTHRGRKQAAQAAATLLKTHGVSGPPVDPMRIAALVGLAVPVVLSSVSRVSRSSESRVSDVTFAAASSVSSGT